MIKQFKLKSDYDRIEMVQSGKSREDAEQLKSDYDRIEMQCDEKYTFLNPGEVLT